MIVIAKWDETFENSDTRKRQRLGWYLQPSGCDSAGYVELMSHGTAGVLAYGVFVAICQWSATCCRDVRGTCRRSDGRSMSRRQIAAAIRMPLDVVTESIDLLLDPEVGWLVEDTHENSENTSVSGESATTCHQSASACESSADDLPGLLKEKEKEKEKEKGLVVASDVPPCPAQLILQQFAAAFGRSVRLTDKRRKALQTRWKDPWWRENWEAALQRGSASRFLSGDNDRGWKIDFEFFTKPDTVTKILEGKYDDHDQRQPKHDHAERRRENANADVFARFRAAAAASGS